MATEGKKEISSDLLNIGTLTLKPDNLDPCGVVVVRDKLVITEFESYKVHVYRRLDGLFLSSSDRLESGPYGVCCVNDTDVCVAMYNGTITLMSVQDSGLISRGTSFHLRPLFDRCDGVAVFSDKIVVSGVKDNTIYWCVVSLQDGRHDNLHKVCGGGFSFLTTKENMVYILCDAKSPDDIGVYGFNLLNPSQPTFRYKPEGLEPHGITADDNGDLFLCDWISNSIHHLTGECELVAIYSEGMPRDPQAIFWDHEILYISAFNVITMYKTPHQDPVIPVEILRMDSNSIQLYKKALQDGKEKVYNIRVMVVGQFGVGKTTLIKRLLGQQVDISERKSTEGIDVHKHCCKISLEKGEWIQQLEDSDQLSTLHRLNKLLSGPDQKPDISQEQDGSREAIYQREITSEIDPIKNSGTSTPSVSDQEVQSSMQLSVTKGDGINDVEHLDNETGIVSVPWSDAKSSESEKKTDAMMEILHLVNENADKLVKDIEKYAALSIWDFAGQYTFYTTHQTFLTSRAIYLLVIDLSQQITDLIKDDQCFLDADGIKLCQVHDLIEIWMNSIHSSVTSPEAIIPVILVGTHVDKLSEKSRKEAIDKYFIELRYMLREKPTVRHLLDDIAIDNTQPDPMLETLKRRIFELSSQQPHWGEEKPARWLPLEQAVMTLKASGSKIVPLSLIEEINMSGSVRIEDIKELELFLRFHHEIGTILYFCVEGLREKIVLDPQWMIDALKSLITAETFIKKNPAITSKLYEFIKTGKLTHELIDVIWTKENNPELHDNKDHILLLMEQLNIIARPRIYIEEGKEAKEEDYFLAPCMLREMTPDEILSPDPHPQMKSSSVLCYTFEGKFLPSPIFHRLLAACIAHWPIARGNLIFCGCCVFQIDHDHTMTLHFREYVIFARVAKMSSKDENPNQDLCIKIRQFIHNNLSKIIECLGSSLQFQLYIQCPKSKGDCLDSLFPVSELQKLQEIPCHSHDSDHLVSSDDILKFWFFDQSTQQPITHEHINQFRLEMALRTICSAALRKILLDHVPAGYTDIYKAIFANKSNLTSKRLLNQDQIKLVFPDPNGKYMATVDQFDITLLYMLIRNVSSVACPKMGWGKAPNDQPRDRTLEANVERIRLYRNYISGHTADGKCGQQEFEDYWQNIDDVLSDIEHVTGKQGYREMLEKCRNQAIPHK